MALNVDSPTPDPEKNPRRLGTALIHYIAWFPLAVGAVAIFQKKPTVFPLVAKREILFGCLLASALATLPLARFIRSRKRLATGEARMLALLQACLGEVCAILGIMYYLFTGDANLAPTFLVLWGVHYVNAVRANS